jgi:hypothetical protein
MSVELQSPGKLKKNEIQMESLLRSNRRDLEKKPEQCK